MIKSGMIIGMILISALFTSVVSADEYDLHFIGGRILSPEPMQFGENAGYSNGTFCTASSDSGNATQRKHVYIQFYEEILTEEQVQIIDNCNIESIIPTAGKGCYIVSMPANLTPADIPAESGLRWMDEILPEDKIRIINITEVPSYSKTDDGKFIIAVVFWEDIDGNQSIELLNDYGATNIHLENKDFNLYEFVHSDFNIIFELANEDIVREIGPGGDPPLTPTNQEATDFESVPENDDNQQSPGFESIISILALVAVLFCLRAKG